MICPNTAYKLSYTEIWKLLELKQIIEYLACTYDYLIANKCSDGYIMSTNLCVC